MGVLIDDIGLDPEEENFYTSTVLSIADDIEFKRSPGIDFLGLSIGFDVEGGGKENADKWKEKALEEDSDFKKIFFDGGFTPIFSLIDSIPDVNVLSAVGVSDPTSALLPLTNTITGILANVTDTPNQFFLTKLDDIIDKKEELLDALNKLKESKESKIQEGIEKLAEILNEIDPRLSKETIVNKVNDKIQDIKSILAIPEIALPEPPYFSLPDLSDLKSFGLSFFEIPAPEIEGVSPEDIIETFFNFESDIPPIGALFVEIAKVKIQMLIEMAAGIPPFIKSAIDKIKEMFDPTNSIKFTIKGVIKAVFDAVVNTFFDKLLQSDKIKNLIEKASTIVYVINGLIKTLIGSLVVSIIGVLFGKGLIMKSTAIGLGLLK
jgi:hypothetical protein